MYKEIVQSVFGDYVGYAVEAGAFDGILDSTTKGIEELGWKVLLVEPIPSAFVKLIKNRNPEYCLNVALGSSNKDNIGFEVSSVNGGASFSNFKVSNCLLSTFGVGLADITIDKILVNERTLTHCLNYVGFPKVDIISLDTEGGELDILNGIDLDKWKPKMLIIENIYSEEISIENYSLYTRVEYNDILTRNG